MLLPSTNSKTDFFQGTLPKTAIAKALTTQQLSLPANR